MAKPITNEDADWIRCRFEYNSTTGILRNTFTMKVTGYVNKRGYVMVGASLPSGRRLIQAHLIAWFLHYGEWPTYEIDHIDQNKSNNAIVNLRLSSRGQNQANIDKNATYGGRRTSSQYKGVHWHKRDKRWFATICFEKENIYLGDFRDEVDAARAYNEAALKYFGEFAVFNEVNG